MVRWTPGTCEDNPDYKDKMGSPWNGILSIYLFSHMFLFSSIHFQCLYRPDAQSINHDPHRQCRSVPEGRPPKAIRGLLLDELATLIRRCGFEGAWRQGGKQSRAVFVGDKFIINQEKSSTWAQGVRAQEIDARLRAARRSGQ